MFFIAEKNEMNKYEFSMMIISYQKIELKEKWNLNGN